MATNRKVSAKELEASGLSLRDFLNKERGLTRKPPPGMKFGDRGTRYPSASPSVSEDDGTGGKSTVDRQDAMLASSRKNAGRPGYDEGGDPIAMRSMAGRPGYDEAGNKMNSGGEVKKMAKGGSASSRADGCCVKGKTKGTVVSMKTGGMSC